MKLYETVEDRASLQKALTTVFKEADKQYNSGLFKNDSPIFDLSCDIIFDMIESLYYPKTPYMFTIIEPSILGKIYESFLAESLVLQNGKIALAKKKEYLYKSVVSTPVEIVRYMVKNTLEPLCKGKMPQEILSLKIADIACGSGVFLEEGAAPEVNGLGGVAARVFRFSKKAAITVAAPMVRNTGRPWVST